MISKEPYCGNTHGDCVGALQYMDLDWASMLSTVHIAPPAKPLWIWQGFVGELDELISRNINQQCSTNWTYISEYHSTMLNKLSWYLAISCSLLTSQQCENKDITTRVSRKKNSWVAKVLAREIIRVFEGMLLASAWWVCRASVS